MTRGITMRGGEDGRDEWSLRHSADILTFPRCDSTVIQRGRRARAKTPPSVQMAGPMANV